jgi:hypothetical protein
VFTYNQNSEDSQNEECILNASDIVCNDIILFTAQVFEGSGILENGSNNSDEFKMNEDQLSLLKSFELEVK